MALKAVIADAVYDQLVDPIKAEYSQSKDGKRFLLVDPVDGYVLENVDALKNALSKERGEAKTFKDRLTAFGDLDPEKARKAIETQVDLASMTPKDAAKAQLDAALNARQEQFDKERKTFIAERDELARDLNESLIDSAAALSIGKHKGNAGLLLPHVRNHTTVVRDQATGKRVARVLNPDRTERISRKSDSTAPMSLDEYVETDLRETFPEAFGGTPAHGGGNESAGRGGSGNHTISDADARTPEKYQAAKAAAEKAGRPLQIV